MHRLLSKIKSNGTRREQEPRPRSTPGGNAAPAARSRRVLNEAAHKLHR
jgi:hypothetical protein